MQSFQIWLRNIPGRANVVADWMSRMYKLEHGTRLKVNNKAELNKDNAVQAERGTKVKKADEEKAKSDVNSKTELENNYQEGNVIELSDG